MAKGTRLVGVSLSLLTLVYFFTGSALAASSPTCGSWSIVPSANRPSRPNSLTAVAAVSANDIWAAGSSGGKTLTEQWNGTQWSIVKSPNTAYPHSVFNALAAVTSTDIWAVGTGYKQVNHNYKYLPLISHWNGSAWSAVPVPYRKNSGFWGVAAVSTNDVWAVGEYTVGGEYRTLIEQWNGSHWSVVPSPNNGYLSNSLAAVTVISANDIWAAGSAFVFSTPNNVTLLEHWDGTQWSIVSSPNVSNSLYDFLNGISADASNDVWAVGYYEISGAVYTLVEQWNGSQWSIVPSPNVQSDSSLSAVAALTNSNAWAVGNYANGQGSEDALIEQWNGSQWSVVTSPNPGVNNALNAVTQIPNTTSLWAVGYVQASQSQTLTEYYC